ncbi:MAG: hypothetical protein CMF17_11785 [Idiomarinaceae bacterium]|nr:hypothetical protein [Idiomarinaceae bacterium]
MVKYEGKFNERKGSDCGVYALSRLLGISYGEARVMLFHHGYRSTGGVSERLLIYCMEKQGLRLEELGIGNGLKACEVSMRGMGLVSVNHHVMPYVDGTLENVNGTGNWFVKGLWRVFREQG